jgi:cytochrome c oxidase subunit 2
MMYLIGILILILAIFVIVQIGKITEVAARLRGEKQAEHDRNEFNAKMMVIFMIGFLAFSVSSAIYYAPYMLGYGPNILPTQHARDIMWLFNVTLFFTGIVFIITHILLFYFAYKYRAKEGRDVLYIPHDNKLEVVWTVIPAVVMCTLVVFSLIVWNETMGDLGDEYVAVGEVSDDEFEYIEIGATGMQFSWILRHPGRDGLLGEKYYKEIDATNQLGQVWTDPKNIDDIILDELVIPVDKTIRARISSRDVLHNFDIPHFFVKMDAVPGIPTYFKFTPDMTTEEYREHLSQYPEWQVPADADEPDGLERWEAFEFELACAELCGKSHYSMRKVVRVVTQEEYNDWLDANEEKSLYLNEIRGTEADPFLDKTTLTVEKRITDRKAVTPAVPAEIDTTVIDDAEVKPAGN